MGFVPKDFDKTNDEFWEYITKRLQTLWHRITWVFTDNEEMQNSSLKGYEVHLVHGLVKEGAQLRSIKDSPLFAESQAWFEMMQTSPTQVIMELYEETLKEINRHAVEIIEQSLRDGELGVLFVDSSVNLPFPEEMRVIRMFPFNPNDYLYRYQVRQSK
ncbi:MAG: hypothetical protein ACFFBD_25725 [Candidatus Hodarchaeota archaeon]